MAFQKCILLQFKYGRYLKIKKQINPQLAMFLFTVIRLLTLHVVQMALNEARYTLEG